MKQRKIMALVALLILLGIGLWSQRPASVMVAEPQDNVAIEVFALGNVDAKVISKIGFEVAGKLSALYADATDNVQKGQLLAKLNEAEQAAVIAKANAFMQEAASSLVKANADVDLAKAVLAERKAANYRKQKLVRSGAVSQGAADQSKRDEQVAIAELKRAYSSVALAKAAIKSAHANIVAEEVRLKQHKLYAPYDGMVIERHKELGSILQAADPLFTIVDSATRWGKLYVDESRAAGITLGKLVRVRLRSQPSKRFEGSVVRIDTESDRVNEERVVYVKCHQCPGTFYLGEQAEAWIQVDMLQQAIMVPQKNIDHYNGDSGNVWIVQDGKLTKAELGFGYKTLDGKLQVVRGLPSGASVVISDISGLKQGDRVRVKKPVVASP
jgi:HlyD family secretion protein